MTDTIVNWLVKLRNLNISKLNCKSKAKVELYRCGVLEFTRRWIPSNLIASNLEVIFLSTEPAKKRRVEIEYNHLKCQFISNKQISSIKLNELMQGVWRKDGRGPGADWRTRTGGRGLADADWRTRTGGRGLRAFQPRILTRNVDIQT
jgi:hypothetical protein